jgi:ribosomal protein S18 acetylase RimI-like enzyme
MVSCARVIIAPTVADIRSGCLPGLIYLFLQVFSSLKRWSRILTANLRVSLTLQAYPADGGVSADPIGVIVCKQSVHNDLANRGYIAMLSVDRKWRKRGIGQSPPAPSLPPSPDFLDS